VSATRRLFFALWPEPDVRAAIVDRTESARLEAALGGRRVPAHNLHLTLVFLGDVPCERLDGLLDAAGQLARPGRFSLRLDRFGTFDRARVAWLGAEPVAAAVRLVDGLERAAEMAAGVSSDDRAWRPHVTLLRGIDVDAAESLPRPGAPIDWPVRGFALVESIRSRPYQVLRTWPVE
jgi:2'-5' RNA ligase